MRGSAVDRYPGTSCKNVPVTLLTCIEIQMACFQIPSHYPPIDIDHETQFILDNFEAEVDVSPVYPLDPSIEDSSRATRLMGFQFVYRIMP
jgi:hypothetical protein